MFFVVVISCFLVSLLFLLFSCVFFVPLFSFVFSFSFVVFSFFLLPNAKTDKLSKPSCCQNDDSLRENSIFGPQWTRNVRYDPF